MIFKILERKNRGLSGILVRAITTSGETISISYCHNTVKTGYFLNGKRIPASYRNNKFFNDLAELVKTAYNLAKEAKHGNS